MPRTKTPDLTDFDRAPTETAQRAVRVLNADELGAVLRVARLKRFGVRGDAARQLGVSAKTLGALERGEAGPKFETLLRLLTDLGLDLVLVPRDPAWSLRDRAPRRTPRTNRVLRDAP